MIFHVFFDDFLNFGTFLYFFVSIILIILYMGFLTLFGIFPVFVNIGAKREQKVVKKRCFFVLKKTFFSIF